MRLKKTIAKLLILSMLCTIVSACSRNTSKGNSTENQTTKSENLTFNPKNYQKQTMKVNGKDIEYRAYENIVYVEKPVDEKYQSMNIYVPEEYFNDKSIGDFTADTAPIFLPNGIGSYLPAEPMKPSLSGAIGGEASRSGLTSGDSAEEMPNSLLMALSRGYVVASPGARGRSNKSADNKYTGKAPAAILDLKAAVRYLHSNDDVIPGSAERIISSGTSAGGALSALLGATGNNSDYESYLQELGAADDRDDIFAVSAYCPITNLENADKAYEWIFNGIVKYTTMNITKDANGNIQRKKEEHTLSSDEQKYSDDLKAEFPHYLDRLKLKDKDGDMLKLGAEGDGTFKDYVKECIIDSAQSALDSGDDLSKYNWITIKNNKVEDVDFDKYVKYIGRSKSVPAFDALDASNPENILFGTEKVNAKHFTEFSDQRETDKSSKANEKIIKLMNPMNYIKSGNTDVAKYWRIRHGLEDSDTSLAIPVILKLELEKYNYNVDFAVPWGQGHGGDYDLQELFEWSDKIWSNK